MSSADGTQTPARRGLKIIGWIAAGLAALMLLLFAVARLLIDPNQHKPALQSALREATGRDVQLQGPLSLSMFPWLAVEANGVSIANRDGFGETPFASVGQARLAVRLWPLLTARRVEFGPVSVDKLQLHLAVTNDGRDNWSDVLEHLQRRETATHPAPSRPQGGEQPLELSIAKVLMHAGEVSFDDAQSGAHYTVSGLTLETGVLRQGQPIDLKAALAVSRNAAPLGRFELRTRLDLTQPGLVTLGNMKGRVTLQQAGKPDTPIDLRSPRLSLHVPTRALEIETLEGRIGDSTMLTSLQVEQAAAGPIVHGTLRVPATNPRKLLQALGIDAPVTRDAAALTRFEAGSQLDFSRAQGLRLDALTATLDGARLTGSISVPDLETQAVRFDLTGDGIDVDRYLPPKPTTGAAEPAPQHEPDEKRARYAALRKLDVAGTLALRSLTVASIALQNVHVDLRARDGTLHADPVRARVFGGDATTRLTIDVRDDTPAIHLEQSLDGVDVGPMLTQLINVRQLQGRGHANFSLDLRGDDVPTLLQTMTGPFDLTVEQGALLGVDLRYEIERAVAATQSRPTGPGTPNSGRTRFDRMHGRGTIANRTLHNDRMEFASDIAAVKGRGDVDYGRNRLDLDLTARLLKAPAGRVLGVKLSRVEGVEIPLRVTGAIGEPKVQPDVTSLLAAVAKGALEEPLEGKVRKKLKKILGF